MIRDALLSYLLAAIEMRSLPEGERTQELHKTMSVEWLSLDERERTIASSVVDALNTFFDNT